MDMNYNPDPTSMSRRSSMSRRHPGGSKMRAQATAISAAFAVSALLGGCGNSSKGAATVATQLDFSMTLKSPSVKAGKVRIAVRNGGAMEHELVAFKTELDEANLPLLPDGMKIDEAGAGITHLDPEAEGVKPGTEKTITIELTPGRYVLVCNLPAHYKDGMHAVLTVT